MKYVSFFIYATLIVLIVLVTLMLGCDSQIVCTDSFCIVPRDTVDGEVVEVDENKVLGLIAKTTEQTPVITPEPEPTAPDDAITLADIVSDVLQNGENTRFIGETVEIEGTVHFNIVVRSNKGGISLVTEYQNIFFYVTDFANPESLRHYQEGQTYTFKVFIRQVLRSKTDANVIYIYSHEVD